MLTPEDNELLCRIAGKNPMGQMVRRYWMPALFSKEIENDSHPVRVRLMGEDLVAFRDSNGDVGLIQELCPHRGASLFLARNEECGLRCLYHGWKFDVSGRVIEMPTEINNEAVNCLISNMRKIINCPQFSDVVFMVEGKPIYAHRAIL